jgi:hypothetical protein
MTDALRRELCLLVNANPNSRSWRRWCDEIGEAGVRQAIEAAKRERTNEPKRRNFSGARLASWLNAA